MGRQRNKPQMKEKEESLVKELNEMESSNFSNKEFKVILIKVLKQLSETHKKCNDSLIELNENYSIRKR